MFVDKTKVLKPTEEFYQLTEACLKDLFKQYYTGADKETVINTLVESILIYISNNKNNNNTEM